MFHKHFDFIFVKLCPKQHKNQLLSFKVTPSDSDFDSIYGVQPLCFVMQMEMDVENPVCVIDGLLLQQLNEIESTGKSEIFTDDVLGVLCMDLFEAGKVSSK